MMFFLPWRHRRPPNWQPKENAASSGQIGRFNVDESSSLNWSYAQFVPVDLNSLRENATWLLIGRKTERKKNLFFTVFKKDKKKSPDQSAILHTSYFPTVVPFNLC
jgi:hypothetical protein